MSMRYWAVLNDKVNIYMYIYIFSLFFVSSLLPPPLVGCFLFALPAYQIRFEVVDIPSTLLEAMIIISFTVWFIRNWKPVFENCKLKIKNCYKISNYKLQIGRYPFDIEIVLILLVSWLAILTAGLTPAALGVWKAYFFEPILVYILVFNVLFDRRPDLTPSTRLRTGPALSFPSASLRAGAKRGSQVPSPLEGEGQDEVSWRMENVLWPLTISAFGLAGQPLSSG